VEVEQAIELLEEESDEARRCLLVAEVSAGLHVQPCALLASSWALHALLKFASGRLLQTPVKSGQSGRASGRMCFVCPALGQTGSLSSVPYQGT
jgi:hypothetical protein